MVALQKKSFYVEPNKTNRLYRSVENIQLSEYKVLFRPYGKALSLYDGLIWSLIENEERIYSSLYLNNKTFMSSTIFLPPVQPVKI